MSFYLQMHGHTFAELFEKKAHAFILFYVNKINNFNYLYFNYYIGKEFENGCENRFEKQSFLILMCTL